MAINVSAANNQAAQLNDDISKLRDAKRQMQAYRSSVSNNWQGKEVTYILTAIDRVIADIDRVIGNTNSLSSDIRSTAAQIKREEDAAAAAARAKAAREQRIRIAQNAYDDAREKLDDLLEKRKELIERFKKSSGRNRIRLQMEILELDETITKAEDAVRNTYQALRAARG